MLWSGKMSADVYRQVQRNAATMSNGLPSTQSRRHWDHCCGIHGAARERKGIKHGTVTARRRLEKEIIQDELAMEEVTDV